LLMIWRLYQAISRRGNSWVTRQRVMSVWLDRCQIRPSLMSDTFMPSRAVSDGRPRARGRVMVTCCDLFTSQITAKQLLKRLSFFLQLLRFSRAAAY
jgi:hypothetical protein